MWCPGDTIDSRVDDGLLVWYFFLLYILCKNKKLYQVKRKYRNCEVD